MLNNAFDAIKKMYSLFSHCCFLLSCLFSVVTLRHQSYLMSEMVDKFIYIRVLAVTLFILDNIRWCGGTRRMMLRWRGWRGCWAGCTREPPQTHGPALPASTDLVTFRGSFFQSMRPAFFRCLFFMSKLVNLRVLFFSKDFSYLSFCFRFLLIYFLVAAT